MRRYGEPGSSDPRAQVGQAGAQAGQAFPFGDDPHEARADHRWVGLGDPAHRARLGPGQVGSRIGLPLERVDLAPAAQEPRLAHHPAVSVRQLPGPQGELLELPVQADPLPAQPAGGEPGLQIRGLGRRGQLEAGLRKALEESHAGLPARGPGAGVQAAGAPGAAVRIEHQGVRSRDGRVQGVGDHGTLAEAQRGAGFPAGSPRARDRAPGPGPSDRPVPARGCRPPAPRRRPVPRLPGAMSGLRSALARATAPAEACSRPLRVR